MSVQKWSINFKNVTCVPEQPLAPDVRPENFWEDDLLTSRLYNLLRPQKILYLHSSGSGKSCGAGRATVINHEKYELLLYGQLNPNKLAALTDLRSYEGVLADHQPPNSISLQLEGEYPIADLAVKLSVHDENGGEETCCCGKLRDSECLMPLSNFGQQEFFTKIEHVLPSGETIYLTSYWMAWNEKPEALRFKMATLKQQYGESCKVRTADIVYRGQRICCVGFGWN